MYSKKHRGCHRNHAVLHGRHGIGMDRGMEQFRRQKEVCSGGYDWVELYNATDNGISLSGYHLQDDKGSEEEYTFSADETIAAGGFYVITEDMFPFGISGNGETITLCDEAYAVIDQITVPAMDDYYTYARTDDGGNSWETVAGGTRGRSNSGTPDSIPGDNTGEKPSDVDYTGLKLNELNGNNKFIELYNASDAEIDISGVYFFKDDEDKSALPEGTAIAAHGFITVWSEKADDIPSDALIFEFGLSADKSVKIELLAPDGRSLDVFKNISVSLGETWGEDDGKYNSKDKGSFARETDGTGDWYIMSATCGATNAGAEKADGTKIEW